jgi:hypothetical protein
MLCAGEEESQFCVCFYKEESPLCTAIVSVAESYVLYLVEYTVKSRKHGYEFAFVGLQVRSMAWYSLTTSTFLPWCSHIIYISAFREEF